MTFLSPARKAGSPNRSNISLILHPAAVSISASASRKGIPRAFARRLPTDVFPAPIIPTRTTDLSSFRIVSLTPVLYPAIAFSGGQVAVALVLLFANPGI